MDDVSFHELQGKISALTGLSRWKGKESDEIDEGDKAEEAPPDAEAEDLVEAPFPELDACALGAEKYIGDEDAEHTKDEDEKHTCQKAFHAPGCKRSP